MAQQLGSNYYNSPYKFNGKELDEETGLYYYGARYYSPRESIWLSVDPLAEKYPFSSPYNYCFDNPINLIDPDGRDVIISYMVGTEVKTLNYNYQQDRNFSEGTSDFLKNTIIALDELYSKNATNVTVGEGSNSKIINELNQFLGNDTHNIYIKEGTKNEYDQNTNTITFNSKEGALFRKDNTKPATDENIGKNSPTALLGHEISHAYNDEFDHDNYINRKKDTSTKKVDVPTSFPNCEEEHVTLGPANQINRNLKEDERTNYGRNYYPVKSPTSTEKQQ